VENKRDSNATESHSLGLSPVYTPNPYTQDFIRSAYLSTLKKEKALFSQALIIII
jgi:hypothetical protein